MKAYRHVYLDFPGFTQESCYEVTSEVTFQNGDKDEIKTTVVCDDPYDAMRMVKEFLLSKRDWLVTEVHGQKLKGDSLLVTKPEIPQPKYAIVCDNIKRIFYENGNYEEVEHYSVIHVVPNDLAVYYGTFDTKEAADERCAKLNKKWEEYLEYDLTLSIEWMPTQFEEDGAEVDCEETAKNLTKMGYQRIVWHNAKKELPELNKYVLGYYYNSQNYVVASWNGVNCSDGHWIYYNIDYWAELPEIKLEK